MSRTIIPDLPDVPDAFAAEINNFTNWYNKAKPGEWYTYHVGSSLHEGLALEYLRKTIWAYACDGKIYIFMQRLKDVPDFFAFKAQKASRRITRLNPLRVASETRIRGKYNG